MSPILPHKEFAESLEADYPILSDPEGKVAKAYGIYNAERMIASRTTFYIGKDRKILFVDNKVKVDEHGEDIAKKLKELEIPKKEK
jgi:peroxiredoxin Q/BCP